MLGYIRNLSKPSMSRCSKADATKLRFKDCKEVKPVDSSQSRFKTNLNHGIGWTMHRLPYTSPMKSQVGF